MVAEKTKITDFKPGESFSFTVTIKEEDLDRFAALSGDVCPLHMDMGFARSRGFDHRVVHGMLLGGYVSRLVGVECPGRNALLHSVNLKFLSPVYIGDSILIKGVIDHVSEAANAIVMRIVIVNTQTETKHVEGKVQVGLTGGI